MWISDRFFLRRAVQKATQLKGILCRRRRGLRFAPYWVLFGQKKHVRFAEPEAGDTNPNAPPPPPASRRRSIMDKWRKYVQEQFRVLRAVREDRGESGGGGGVSQGDGGRQRRTGGGGPNPPARGRFVQDASTDDERERRPPQEYFGLEVEDDPSLERLLTYAIPATDPKRRSKAGTRRSRGNAMGGTKGRKSGSINSRSSSGSGRRHSRKIPHRRKKSRDQRNKPRDRKKKRKRTAIPRRIGSTGAQPPSFDGHLDDDHDGLLRQLTSSGSPSSGTSSSTCEHMNDSPSSHVPALAALPRGRYQQAPLELRAASRVIVAKAEWQDVGEGPAGPPKRPPNAFLIFSQRCRQEFGDLVRARVETRTVSMLLGNVWRFMSKQERQVFYDEAQVRRQRYQEYTDQQQHEQITQEGSLKRPPNAFVLFCQDHRSLIQPPGHGGSSRACLKECARRWRRLKAKQKRLYQQKAQRAQTLYLSRKHHLLHSQASPPPCLEERPPVLAIEYEISNDQSEPTSAVTENPLSEAAGHIQSTVPLAGSEEQPLLDLPSQDIARGLELTRESSSQQQAEYALSVSGTDDGKTEFTEFATEGHVRVIETTSGGVQSATPSAGPEGPHVQQGLPAPTKPGHRSRMGRNNNKLFTDSSDTDSASQIQTLSQLLAATAGKTPPPSHPPLPPSNRSGHLGLGCRRRQCASMPPTRNRLQGRAVVSVRAAAALITGGITSTTEEADPGTAKGSESSASVERDVSFHNIAGNQSCSTSDLSLSCDLEGEEEDQRRKRKRKKKKKKKKQRCPHVHDALERNVHWKDEAERWGTCAICDPVTSALCDEDVAHALLSRTPRSFQLPSSAILSLPSQQQTALPPISFCQAFRRECNLMRKPANPASGTASLDSLHVASDETTKANNPFTTYTCRACKLCPKDGSFSSLQSSRRSSSCVSVDCARVRVQTAALKAHLNRLQSMITHLSLSSSSSACSCSSFLACQTLSKLAAKAQSAGLKSYYSNNCLPSSVSKGIKDRTGASLACELRSRHMMTISPGLTAGLFSSHYPYLPVYDIIRGCSCHSKIEELSGTGSSNQESSTSVDDLTRGLFSPATLKTPCTQSSSVDASVLPMPKAFSTSHQIANNAEDSLRLPIGDTDNVARANERSWQDNDGDADKKNVLRDDDASFGVPGSLSKTTLPKTKDAPGAHFLAHKSAFQKVASSKHSSNVSVVSVAKPRLREECDSDRYRFQPIKESYSSSSSFEELRRFRAPEDSVQDWITSKKHSKKAETRPLHSKDYNQSSLICDGGLGSMNICSVPRAFSLDAEEDLCFQMDPMMLDFLQDMACESFSSFSTTEPWLGVGSGTHLSREEIELDCLLETLCCEDLLHGSSFSSNILNDYADSSFSLDTMPSTITTTETKETSLDLDLPAPKLRARVARMSQSLAPSKHADAIADKRRLSTKRKASPGALAIVNSSNNSPNHRACWESTSGGLPKYPSLRLACAGRFCNQDGCLCCSGAAGSTSVRRQSRGSKADGCYCRRRRRRCHHHNNSDTRRREPNTTQAVTQLDLLHEPSEGRRRSTPAWLTDLSLPRFLEVEYCVARGWI